MSENRSIWPTVLTVGGTLLACGAGAYLFSKLIEAVEEAERQRDEEEYELEHDFTLDDFYYNIEDLEDDDMFEHFGEEEFIAGDDDEDEDEDDQETGEKPDIEELVAEVENFASSTARENHDSGDENWKPSQNNPQNGSAEAYSWTQTYDEAMLEFPVDKAVKAKDIQCTFNTNSICVNVGGESMLQGQLCMPIQPDGCSWELDGSGDDRVLLVSLVKAPLHPGFWTKVTKGSKAIKATA